MRQIRPRISGNKLAAFENITKDESRILVVGDIHAPFELSGYLDFCKSQYENWNCNRVVFIGDIIDNHYSSYHETDPDGLGGGQELDLAIRSIRKWYDLFPDADVLIGNHDRIIMRKSFSSAIPARWIKSYNEVLGTPGWRWHDRVVIDGVQYVHGEGGTARTKTRNDMMSTVQGHIHTQAYTDFFVGQNYKVFACQVGCGVDSKTYAAAYARHFKKQAIGCAVIIGGHTPINLMMNL